MMQLEEHLLALGWRRTGDGCWGKEPNGQRYVEQESASDAAVWECRQLCLAIEESSERKIMTKPRIDFALYVIRFYSGLIEKGVILG